MATGVFRGHESQIIDTVLDINADDIKQGKKGDCYKCPAALASLRALAQFGVTWASAGSNELNAGFGPAPVEGVQTDSQRTVRLFHATWPEDLRYWISRFDSSSEAKPITVPVRLRFDQ